MLLCVLSTVQWQQVAALRLTLRHPLEIRINLHAGHVAYWFSCRDDQVTSSSLIMRKEDDMTTPLRIPKVTLHDSVESSALAQ